MDRHPLGNSGAARLRIAEKFASLAEEEQAPLSENTDSGQRRRPVIRLDDCLIGVATLSVIVPERRSAVALH